MKNTNKDTEDTKKIIATTKRKLVAQMKHLLLPLGFVQTKNAFWNRFTETMRHSFEFRQLRDNFDMRYGYMILDKYGKYFDDNPNEYAYSYLYEKRWNLPDRMEEVEILANELMDYINEGLHYFERHGDPSQLVLDYEKGKIDKAYFASSPGWQEYRIGIAYHDIDRLPEAIQYFQEVIDKWSDENIPFILTRKKMAERWISDIEKKMKPAGNQS